MQLQGTKTEDNLKHAFAGESQANRRCRMEPEALMGRVRYLPRPAFAALVLVALASFPGVSPPARATSVDGLIPVGLHPFHVGVNPATNRIYASNSGDGTLSVIAGETDTVIATIPVGLTPEDVAANPATNRVYAVSFWDRTVTVIDGASNTVIATVPLGGHPLAGALAVAVNPATNRVYIGRDTNEVSVLDGATNTMIAPIPTDVRWLAVNPATNRVYVSQPAQQTVAVIDGASHAIIDTIQIAAPGGIDVNPVTNRVYVAVSFPHGLAVIDGASGAVVATVPLPGFAHAVAVNPATNRVYVSGEGGALFVVDGTSNTVVDVFAVGVSAAIDMAVNPATNRVYVPLTEYDTVWVDPPQIGGTRLKISPRPEGVRLSWSAGTLERGYSIARWGTDGPLDNAVLDMLPRSGPLPAGTTSFTDREPLTKAGYLYAVLPLDASGGFLWMSDPLGLLPNTQQGADAPLDFTLRSSGQLPRSDVGPALAMTWRDPGGQTEYVLATLDSEDGDQLRDLGNETAAFAFVSEPSCYTVWAVDGGEATGGHTHSLCAMPLSSLENP